MSVLKDKKILIVDDEEGIRDLIVSELEFNDAVCYQATTGKEAIEAFKTQKFDAVISDIKMPDGDGLFFLEQTKDTRPESCIMLFITGHTDIPLEEFYDRGVEAVISKPFKLEQLMSTLEMALTVPRMAWRREPRVAAALNVTVNWAGLKEPLTTRTFNFGRGGLFVQTLGKELPKAGSRVKFSVSHIFEGRDGTLSGEMIVRWIREKPELGTPAGFGAEFLGLSQEQMDEIASITGLARTRVYIPKK